ncbi:MAG: DHH family phosphoesterase [Prevotellaceae bacterium]|nr:DHH family phosphoesterase [Candidatus Faecinaster equi]
MLKEYLDKELLGKWNVIIDNAEKVLIVGHSKPDGDAVGSMIAMNNYLLSKNKITMMCVPNSFPNFLEWLPTSDKIRNFDYCPDTIIEFVDECDLIICLDFNDWSRVDNMTEMLQKSEKKKILIDHHTEPFISANIIISDNKAAATCEIIFALMHQLGEYDSMTKATAECLYCGLMTDTGSFEFNSTRSEVFLMVAKLLDKGIDKDVIYRKVYHNFTIDRIRLMGYLMNEKLVYLEKQHTAFYTLTDEEMTRFHYYKGCTEGVVNIPQQIKGLKLSISMREDKEKGKIYVSLRSVDDLSCADIAARFFNGGGHVNAAGGTLYCSMDEAVKIVYQAVEYYKDELEKV